jgi:hypothetical protein
MSVKQIVGAEQYEKMRKELKAAFPDERTVVTDAVVDAAFQVAKHQWKATTLANLPIPAPAAAAPHQGPPFQYYEALATHARVAPPFSVFTGRLPLVRFRIPDRGTAQTLEPIDTPAGRLLPSDRLAPSVDVLWATFGSDPQLQVGRPERVDMITPPRLAGARFAAISLYLCYERNADANPSFYILEAGLATGEARMPFLGRTMSSLIVAQTQYKPTTFSRRSHFYRGKLLMDAAHPGEPSLLSVEVFKHQPPSDPYLRVTVEYHKRTEPLMTNPFHITIGAAARVQAIADALGVPSELDPEWFLKLIDAVALNQLFSTPPHT